jgi:uncharacterized membrane protein YdjX (TVP38/TMEM64 family)
LPKFDSKAVWLFFTLTALIVGSSVAVYYSGLADVFLSRERLIAFINEHRDYAVPVFIGVQVLQVVAAPIPGEVSGFAGGFLFGPLWGVAYSTIGLSVGSWVAFTLARLLGRPLVERLVSAEVMSRYDYVMGHRGLLLVFLLFLLPGFPKDYLCYLLGLGHMRVLHFLGVSIAGRLLGTVLLTLAGAYFEREHYGALFAVVGVSIAIVLVAMIYRTQIDAWLRRHHITHRHEHETDKTKEN